VLDKKSLIKKTNHAAVQIAGATLREGIDARDGGLFYTATPHQGITNPNKDWWPQAEAVLGFLNAWKIDGAPHFLKAAQRSWAFIQEKLHDTEHGEWFWAWAPDGRPDTWNDKAGPWKCPYHNGRACMEIMQMRIDEG
jgi:mannobiose 2-epimerase